MTSNHPPIVRKNQFNGETFIFSEDDEHNDYTSFDVILASGGTGGGNALVHVHPEADEHFHVHEGCLEIVVEGRTYLVEAGQSALVPKGKPHYFRNASCASVEMTVGFSPRQRHREFFMTFSRLAESKPEWFSKKGDPNLLFIAMFLHSFSDHLYLANIPTVVQRAVFRILAPIARWRGYKLY